MFYRFLVIGMFCGLLAGTAGAENITLHMRDGQTISGEIVDISDAGIKLRLVDGTYTPQPIAYGLMSQDDLKGLRQIPKAVPFAEPFIEIPRAEKLARSKVDPKEVPHLDRPRSQSLFGAMATSSLGVVMLLLIYGGNLYAAYEISVFRAQPAGLVIGLSAVLPVIVPVIFLAMPTRAPTVDEGLEAPPDAALEAAIAAEQAPAGRYQTRGATPATARAQTTKSLSAAAAPERPSKTFQRGQFTFNRRFFETQVPGFFAIMRPEADKEMVLVFKSARGVHTAQRISRISPNEIYLQVQKGQASEEVILPFVEIQEVILKHKDAP